MRRRHALVRFASVVPMPVAASSGVMTNTNSSSMEISMPCGMAVAVTLPRPPWSSTVRMRSVASCRRISGVSAQELAPKSQDGPVEHDQPRGIAQRRCIACQCGGCHRSGRRAGRPPVATRSARIGTLRRRRRQLRSKATCQREGQERSRRTAAQESCHATISAAATRRPSAARMLKVRHAARVSIASTPTCAALSGRSSRG